MNLDLDVVFAPNRELTLDGELPFSRHHLIGVPATAGVYVIRDLTGPLYVGRTCNLRQRCAQHIESTHNVDLAEAVLDSVGPVFFGWIAVRPDLVVRAEQRLIALLRPRCNKTLVPT